MKLNKSELNKLLAQVTDDVQELLKHEADEGESLSKADEGEEAPAEKKPEGSSSEPTGEEASAAPPAGPEASADAGPPPGPEAGMEGAPPEGEGSPTGDPAADAGATPEALQAEYAQLPPEELKMHFLACKAALMAVMSGQPGADGAAGGPPPGPEASADAGAAPMGGPPGAPPAGPEASAPVPPAPQFGKKEFKSEGSGGQMSKSEKEFSERLSKAEEAMAEVVELKKALASKDQTIAALEENVGKVAAGFEKLLTRQQVMRKSLTGISYVTKPGAEVANPTADFSHMSKSEVVRKLNEVTASPNLSSADRNLITRYTVGTDVPVSTVAKFL